MQGGARAQNAIIPMNLLNNSRLCDVVITGYWSKQTAKEAAKYGTVNIASSSNGNYISIPSLSSWAINKKTSYIHICSNETVNGVEFCEWPDLNLIDRGHVPLVVDMSSNILSKCMDFTSVGLAYASAQKNIGPAGLTLVVVNESLLKDCNNRGMEICPSVFDYRNLIKTDSLYNTPPTYSIYMAGLMFDWLIKKGGIREIEKINMEKSKLLYETLDLSGFYQTPVLAEFRSKVNVPFFLPSEDLNDIFIEGARKQGLINLKGHSALGGLRASLYNSMPIEGVKALVNWLKEFEINYG
jgi:phosphoserine aminotransferase